MNVDDLVIGWRELLLALIALLSVYVVIAAMRLRRLRQKPVDLVVGEGAGGSVSDASHSPEESSEVPALPGTELVAGARKERDFPWNEPPESPPLAGTALVDRLQQAERDLILLREELAILRGEFAAMREENARALERLQAAQNVAPIYGDAMQMAAAGYDAMTIAERCGVARAEAELVVALIRNRNATDTMRER